jgi:putative IMPACT (imprinted ancient) family translation regulator
MTTTLPEPATREEQTVERPSTEEHVAVETAVPHPALQRLRTRLESSDSDSGLVTNYSRMHHRHSRT